MNPHPAASERRQANDVTITTAKFTRSGPQRIWLVKVLPALIALALSLSWPSPTVAYSVLSHEAIIDSAWDADIRPLLLKRFPGATPEELKEAHGYAYGGAIIQDMGYYPHGSFFFSDLTHLSSGTLRILTATLSR